jgi:hypothetical protein
MLTADPPGYNNHSKMQFPNFWCSCAGWTTSTNPMSQEGINVSILACRAGMAATV